MNNPAATPPHDPEFRAIEEKAAEWFGRVEIGLTAREERDFLRWLKSDAPAAVGVPVPQFNGLARERRLTVGALRHTGRSYLRRAPRNSSFTFGPRPL